MISKMKIKSITLPILGGNITRTAYSFLKGGMSKVLGKFIAAEKKHGWKDRFATAARVDIQEAFWDHVRKGDPLDVIIYCLIMVYRGWSIEGEFEGMEVRGVEKCHYCDNPSKGTLIWLKDKQGEPANIHLPWCGCDLRTALKKFWQQPYPPQPGRDFITNPPIFPSDESEEKGHETFIEAIHAQVKHDCPLVRGPRDYIRGLSNYALLELISRTLDTEKKRRGM